MVEGDPSPWEVWSAVPEAEQREVTRLAKLGRRHPDPDVASAAEDWADVIVEAHRQDNAGGGRLLSWAFSAIELWVGLWGPNMDTASEHDQLRWAKRVLRAR